MNPILFLGIFLCHLSSEILVSAVKAEKSDIQFSSDKNNSISQSGSKVKFLLYTRQTLTNPDISTGSSGSFASFKNNKPLKVVIHGWLGSDNQHFCKMVREGLLANLDANVILVDWSRAGSKIVLYPAARMMVPKVAAAVAEFLDNLNHQYGVRLEEIHVLGHSLGAHIAGIAGYKVKTGKIGRITGMDPAGPAFSKFMPTWRLSPNSALFVDVIHTCGHFLGMDVPIGHADFYPNSGLFIQPGCRVDLTGSCSHGRSYILYIESLANKKAFPAVTCPSWKVFKNNKQLCDMSHIVYMGEGLSANTRGVYYFSTNGNAPYGLGRI